MKLERVKALPKKVIENIDEVEHLRVYIVQDYNNDFLKSMVDFGIDIFGDLGADEWSLVPQVRHGNVFVLKEDKKKNIIGLAIFMRDWEDDKKVYLYDYAIKEELHGQGLGYHFLRAIIRNLREQGFSKMGLTVDVDNAAAIRLYKDKIGFDIIKLRKDEYGEGEDRYIMELDFDKVK